jgi:lathosterol oxidase
MSTLGGLAIYWIVGAYYHLRYYVARAADPAAWKCQPKRFLRDGQQRDAILLSSLNLTIAGIATGTFIYAIERGATIPIYFDVAERGWLYAVASTVLLFLLVDALAYYAHRAMHQRTMFRLIHRHHHRFLAPTPFVVVAMHPIEFVIFQAATFLPMFVLPLHYASAIAVFVYVFVFNIIDHSGVRLESRLPWQGPSRYHDDHHVYFHCNFGQHLTLWDRLHGTLRRVDRGYGVDVFGGKGAALDHDASADAPRYVEY